MLFPSYRDMSISRGSSSISNLLAVLTAWFLLTIVAQPGLSASILGANSLPPTAVNLYPRKSQSFYRRELSESSLFHPRSTVIVEYDYGASSSPSVAIPAVVSFEASEKEPIVMIGAFDELLQSIECMPNPIPNSKYSGIHILFKSRESASEASIKWKEYERLDFVTSHQGCNIEGELGAWRVHAVETDVMTGQLIRLLAESIPLHELGSYNIDLRGHAMSGIWQPQSIRNQFARRKIFGSAFNKDFSGTSVLSADTSGLPDALQDQLKHGHLDIQCIECSVSFNFTVDVNVTLSNLNITAMSVTTKVNSFDQSILLGVSLGAGDVLFSDDHDLFNLPLTDIAIRDLVNIGPEVGVATSLELDLSGMVNFTIGAKGSIDSGAFASFDFLRRKESDQGWDSANFESIPLKLQSGSLNSTLTLTISPFIGIGVTSPLNDDKPLVEARISQNAPSIIFSSNITENVNRNCEPLGANDFESFSTAYQLAADMTFATHVSLVGNVADILPPWDNQFSHGDFQFFNHTGGDGASPCFVVVDDNSSGKTSSALLTAAPSGTLLAAASAVPSFDVPKIESYFSAHGQLPTNVNYAQLIQATTVPDDIKNAVQNAAHAAGATSSAAPKLKLIFGALYSSCMIVTIYSLM